MKIAVGIVSVLVIAFLLMGAGLYTIGSYKLKSEISVNQYVDVLEVQNMAPYLVDKAMEDGVITYSEYYKIVDEAKRNMLVLAKVKIVLQNPATQSKAKKYDGQEIILQPRGLIKLEEKEGLLND